MIIVIITIMIIVIMIVIITIMIIIMIIIIMIIIIMMINIRVNAAVMSCNGYAGTMKNNSLESGAPKDAKRAHQSPRLRLLGSPWKSRALRRNQHKMSRHNFLHSHLRYSRNSWFAREADSDNVRKSQPQSVCFHGRRKWHATSEGLLLSSICLCCRCRWHHQPGFPERRWERYGKMFDVLWQDDYTIA